MFGDDAKENSWRRTVLFLILLTGDVIAGIVGGVGLAYAAGIDTADHQVLGIVFCFIAFIALMLSAFLIFLHREREQRLLENPYEV